MYRKRVGEGRKNKKIKFLHYKKKAKRFMTSKMDCDGALGLDRTSIARAHD